ncbi:HD domain-containing protein [Mucilaginibacter sp. KACC 22063]|uniref:HD domain-containing protein n=1 Tax=Mucilaginibacter sp. KACC 22063 TaxID=3025666 RepID=UPI0023667465|nr:HD domain-containing protein [Mucilaginibacter sp. KACC 22063]WDF55035.1 HD domain-containing protein [Mucilaginibacter sp. KACC 22063]
MDNLNLINLTVNFVKKELQNAEAGHDWWHILRVWNNAKLIGSTEKANMLVVELAALLHDIADSKFNNGDEEIGPQTAADFLRSVNADTSVVHEVEMIIRHMSFKASFDEQSYFSPELAVVQDADRLDAIGAIGIARAFTYGGFKNRELYNPEIKPDLNLTKEAYKKSTAPTINHFYEKLLLLKDKMNTVTGKQLAAQRHDFMLQYLDHFYREWNGEA